MCYSAQIRQDILDGKKILPTNIEELQQAAKDEGWTDSKYQFMRRALYPTEAEHEKDIAGFYHSDPYVPI